MIDNLVIVRSGGDIATGTIHKLVKCGFRVVVLEVEHPTVIRRTVAFAQAVYDGKMIVEGLTSVKVTDTCTALLAIEENKIPVLVDAVGNSIDLFKPYIVIDAIIAKKNLGTHKGMAPIVIALGPGFSAGDDVHAVIETNRGHNLGRVIYEGSTEPDTGHPGMIEGYGWERVIRAPFKGKVKTKLGIGSIVRKGDIVAYVDDVPVRAPLKGVVRGLIEQGTVVDKLLKIGDIDPRGKVEHCFTISDKARAVAGGVLEAILYLSRDRK